VFLKIDENYALNAEKRAEKLRNRTGGFQEISVFGCRKSGLAFYRFEPTCGT